MAFSEVFSDGGAAVVTYTAYVTKMTLPAVTAAGGLESTVELALATAPVLTP